MNLLFLATYLLIPFVTCFNIKERSKRHGFQLLMLLTCLFLDSYIFYSAQIHKVRNSGHISERYWPWGRAGISDEAIYYGASWSINDYSFIDHLAINHLLYIAVSGLAFYSYIFFFSKVYDYVQDKKLEIC